MSDPLKYLVFILGASIFFSCKKDEPVAVQPVTEVKTQKQKLVPNHALQIPRDEILLKENQTLQPIDDPNFYDGKATIVKTILEPTQENLELQHYPYWVREKVSQLHTEKNEILSKAQASIEKDNVLAMPQKKKLAWKKSWEEENLNRIHRIDDEVKKLKRDRINPEPPSKQKIEAFQNTINLDAPIFHESDIVILEYLLREKTKRALQQKPDSYFISEYKQNHGVLVKLLRTFKQLPNLDDVANPDSIQFIHKKNTKFQ